MNSLRQLKFHCHCGAYYNFLFANNCSTLLKFWSSDSVAGKCSALSINPGHTNKGGGRMASTLFPSFFLEDQTSASEVFSSCSFIPRTSDFETSLVMISYYGYEI